SGWLATRAAGPRGHQRGGAVLAADRLATDRPPTDRPPQRRAGRWRPILILRLHVLVPLGVAVERAFEISERDDEAGPAVAIAVLQEIVLDERPDTVAERARHLPPLARGPLRAPP